MSHIARKSSHDKMDLPQCVMLPEFAWRAGHLSARLVEAGVKGRHLTLKIKRKKAGAPEPVKFLVLHSCLSVAWAA